MYLDRASLAFPRSLPEFQRLFPDDAACAAYLEKSRWDGGFVCPHCQMGGEPFRFDNRPGVLRCRKCRKNTGLTVGTVMECSHAPLSVWFWAAYLVASQTQDMSAAQFQRQLGLTATRRPSASCTSCAPAWCAPIRTGSAAGWVNMSRWTRPMSAQKTRGEGRGVHHKTLVATAVEVRHREPGTARDKRKDGRYAGRVRLYRRAARSTRSPGAWASTPS